MICRGIRADTITPLAMGPCRPVVIRRLAATVQPQPPTAQPQPPATVQPEPPTEEMWGFENPSYVTLSGKEVPGRTGYTAQHSVCENLRRGAIEKVPDGCAPRAAWPSWSWAPRLGHRCLLLGRELAGVHLDGRVNFPTGF
jgi:hypothetical protein